MCEPVAEREVVCLVKTMIQTARKEIIIRVERKQSAIRLKLIDQERIQSRLAGSDKQSMKRIRVGIHRQQALKAESACLRGQMRDGSIGIVDARYPRIARQCCKRPENRILRPGRKENICVGKKRHCVLGILTQSFKCQEPESLVLLDRKPGVDAELIPLQGILDRRSLRRGSCGIKHLSGLERLAESKRIARVQGIVAEEPKRTPVNVVRSGLGHNINRCAACRPQISLVVAPVDLELLDGILAQRC